MKITEFLEKIKKENPEMTHFKIIPEEDNFIKIEIYEDSDYICTYSLTQDGTLTKENY